MKSNLFVMMCAVALVLGVCSCGGNQELTKMIPASAVKITGDDKDFFKLAGDSVKIILTNDRPNDDDTWEVKAIMPFSNTKSWAEVKEMRKKKPNWSGVYGISSCDYETKVNYYDENGSNIDLDSKVEGFDDLLKSEEITTGNVTVKHDNWGGIGSYERIKQNFDKVAGVKLEIELSWGAHYDEEMPAASEDKTATSSDSDWDSILDEYEKYVDKYVAVYKKAMNGDMNALSESVSLAEQAEKLGDKLSKGQGAMTSAQMNRYTKIVTKMTNAMQ